MSHMIIYRGADGKPGYHQTDEIHDAIAFVESLRNGDGLDQARIFRMEEVPFEFRPYFRVEIAGQSSAPAVGAGFSESASPAPSTTAPAVDLADSQAPKATEDVAAAAPKETAAATATVATDAPAPSAGSSTESENGIGARRGLFGR